jgi:flagellar assembly protein FliH
LSSAAGAERKSLSRTRTADGPKVSRFAFPSFEDSEGTARGARPVPRTPEEAERDGYARGFAAGKTDGAEDAAREAGPLLEGLRRAAEALLELRGQIVREAEPQVVDLAVAIARRIVIEELSTTPERIVGIVKEAIRRIERVGPVTIKVHPDLHNLIAGRESEISPSRAEILFDVDPSIPPAGPVVVGTTEEVLTDVDAQILTIVDDMRSARAAR